MSVYYHLIGLNDAGKSALRGQDCPTWFELSEEVWEQESGLRDAYEEEGAEFAVVEVDSGDLTDAEKAEIIRSYEQLKADGELFGYPFTRAKPPTF